MRLFILLLMTFSLILSGCSFFGSSSEMSGVNLILEKTKFNANIDEDINVNFKLINNNEASYSAANTLLYFHGVGNSDYIKISPFEYRNNQIMGIIENDVDFDENYFTLNFKLPGERKFKLNRCDFIEQKKNFILCVDSANELCSFSQPNIESDNLPLKLKSFKYDVIESGTSRKVRVMFDFKKTSKYSVIKRPSSSESNSILSNKPNLGSQNNICLNYENGKYLNHGVWFDVKLFRTEGGSFENLNCRVNFFDFGESSTNSKPTYCDFNRDQSDKKIRIQIDYSAFVISQNELTFNINN